MWQQDNVKIGVYGTKLKCHSPEISQWCIRKHCSSTHDLLFYFEMTLIKTCEYCHIWFLTVLHFQVLDAGNIHAFDAPYTLLQDKQGIFYKMVQQTGKQEAAALLAASKEVIYLILRSVLHHKLDTFNIH